jgi:tetratricopeptide (TPR) repeat protein
MEMIGKATILLVLCSMLLASSVFAQTAERLYAEAKASEASGKSDVAFLLYRQLVRQYPESAYADESLFLIGQYYYESRNYVDATKAFGEHQQKFPKSQFKQPIQDYLARMSLRSLKERADGLFEEGKLGPASVLYQQYLKVDPENLQVQERLKQITQTMQDVQFGFEQLNRERKKLEEEKADLNRSSNRLEAEAKRIQALEKSAQELNKSTVAEHEKQIASLETQMKDIRQETADMTAQMKAWRQRALIAEALELTEPLPKRFQETPDAKSLPEIVFAGRKEDPAPQQGEVQVTAALQADFPVVIVTEAKLDSSKNTRHVEAIVIADLASPWPQGARMKFRVDFVGKAGQSSLDPAFLVRYYEPSDMDEINETTKTYRKKVLFTVAEGKVESYQVSAFLVKNE